MRLFQRVGQRRTWLPFDLPIHKIEISHQIFFTSIILQADLTWKFTWDDIDAQYYRVVLRGREIGAVTGSEFTFDGSGPYFDFPPPIEIMFEEELAASEINKPFLNIQWYRDSRAEYYEVYQSGIRIYSVTEVGSPVYSFSTPYISGLKDFTVIAFNGVGEESDPHEINILIVTPPLLGPLSVTYDVPTEQIIVEAQ